MNKCCRPSGGWKHNLTSRTCIKQSHRGQRTSMYMYTYSKGSWETGFHPLNTLFMNNVEWTAVWVSVENQNRMVAGLGGSVGCAVRLWDQEVAGSTPAEVGNILSWRLIMKYFLRSFSPFRWFKKGSCQFLAKECAQYCLTA